jgi:hypothetical protein
MGIYWQIPDESQVSLRAIILTVKHFCRSGVHENAQYYRASLNNLRDGNVQGSAY